MPQVGPIVAATTTSVVVTTVGGAGRFVGEASATEKTAVTSATTGRA